MRTVINKIFFGVIFIFLSWKGSDGLIINLKYQSVSDIDIEALEEDEQFESRNLNVLNGIRMDDFIYYSSGMNSPIDIVYPLISAKQKAVLDSGDLITIKVFVRLTDQQWNCLDNQYCIPEDSSSIRGLVKTGLENIRSSDFSQFETAQVGIDESAILVQPGAEPISWQWNLAMFLGGTIFGFTILKSFFRRASSLKEYWAKITEKEES